MHILASFSTPISTFAEWPDRKEFVKRLMAVRTYYNQRTDEIIGARGGRFRNAIDSVFADYSSAALLSDGYVFYVHVPQFSERRPELANAVMYFHYGEGVEMLANQFTMRQLVNRKRIDTTKLRLRPDAALSLGVIQSVFKQVMDLSTTMEATVIDRGDGTPLIFTAIWPDAGPALQQDLINGEK